MAPRRRSFRAPEQSIVPADRDAQQDCNVAAEHLVAAREPASTADQDPASPPSTAAREPTAAPEYRVVIALREVTLRLNLIGAEFAARHDLHTTDLRAIIELLDAERAGLDASPTWLGERLRLNSASVTALLDRLERVGYVQRTRESADRRRVRLQVSDSAKRLGEAFFGPLIERVIRIMDGRDPHEQDTIMRFLAEITAAVSQ